MPHPQKQLFVVATHNAQVYALSSSGDIISSHNQPMRVIGKQYNSIDDVWEVDPSGTLVPYHPEYIRHLKEHSLLPGNLETAIAAGVSLPVSKKDK